MAKDIQYMDDECRTCTAAAFCGVERPVESRTSEPCGQYRPLARIAALEAALAAARRDNDMQRSIIADLRRDRQKALDEIAALRARADKAKSDLAAARESENSWLEEYQKKVRDLDSKFAAALAEIARLRADDAEWAIVTGRLRTERDNLRDIIAAADGAARAGKE